MNTEVKIGERVIVEREKVGRFAAGISALVIGAMLVAESFTATIAGQSFMLLDGVSRELELVVGVTTIIFAACIIDESKNKI